MDETVEVGSRCEPRKSGDAKRHDYFVGILLLFLVVLLWTASNFLTNNILTTAGWNKPFAVTYANTSSFALYLIPFALALTKPSQTRTQHLHPQTRNSTNKRPGASSFWSKLGFSLPNTSSRQHRQGSYSPLTTSNSSSFDNALRPPSPTDPRARLLQGGRPSSIDGRRPAINVSEVSTHFRPPLTPLSVRETAILAGQFTLVWFAANWSLTAALGMTSVASGTTLSSASGFFTLALGSLTGAERVTKAKLLAVVVSFLGVALVTHADSLPQPDGTAAGHTPINGPLGDFLALLSAFCYAVYVTLLKLRIKSEDRVSMPLFFGFVGAFNIIGMWPIGLGLHLTGWETFQLPADSKVWTGVTVNMGITFISDFAYLLSMLKTAPLIATVGLSLTIPLAVCIDLLLGTHTGGVMANIGSLAVLLSFVAIGWDDMHSTVEPAMADDSVRGRSINSTIDAVER